MVEPERPSYSLSFEPDGTSGRVRDNLGDILERELLGPANGPEEILPISPRQLYLVGHIAPVKLRDSRIDLARVEDGEAIIEARGDTEGAHEQRGVPALAVDEGGAESDQDDVDDRAPQKGLMIPASMGLRFQLPMDVEAFSVVASWGTYETTALDGEDAKGQPRRGYRRTPVEIVEPIRVEDVLSLGPGQTLTRVLTRQVCLRVDVFDDPQYERRLVEIALCNDKVTPPTIPVSEWLFQTRLEVRAPISREGEATFLPVQDVLTDVWPESDEELRRLRLQYRDRLEYAVGRTCSVGWDADPAARRAKRVWTTWLPVAETPQTRAESVTGALLSMDALASAGAQELQAGLAPLVTGYQEWLDGQAERAAALPDHLRSTAEDAVDEARWAQQRLAAGLEFVLADPEALTCFRFMNEVMREQRIHSQIAVERSSDPTLSLADALARVRARGDSAASWRPFQLAFVLMQLPALSNPAAPARSGELASVELLFFPTGGGKTEAYLGLAAYTFAARRRAGLLDTPDGLLDGGDGLAVLMRYTLRLLTAQQFQRATALVCAAELARRRDPATWGERPFRIGLWVGTDVSPKRFDEAVEQLERANDRGAGFRLPVLQLQRCPWCGTPISHRNVVANSATRRVLVYCGDDLARCPFARGGEVGEGLPVLTVDEEIYRLTPAFVIATVDKFARLAREGEAASLFGYVSRRCERHGYVHPDYPGCSITSSHRAENGLPAAMVRAVPRLRPPDLIIQDELHLITGALGTAVGLFEVAVDLLCRWHDPRDEA